MLAYNPRKSGITQSLLMGFLKCRQYAKHSLDGWTSLRTSAALQFGELAHAVLEQIYSEVRDKKRTKPPTKEEIWAVIAKQIEIWEKSPRGQRASADAVQQLEQNAALLEAVLPGYFKHWGTEDFKKIKWVALEKEFEIDYPIVLEGKSTLVKIRGKIDGVHEDGSRDLVVDETKTKGRIEEGNIQDLLAFDFQTDYYGLACEKIFGRLPKSARYNIIRRPGEKLLKGENLEDYRDRVAKRVEEEPEHYFYRYRIAKSKSDFGTFRKELDMKIKEFVDWCEGRLPTYRNETACQDRFGACRYLKICASGNYTGFYKRKKVFEELNAEKEA